MATQEITNASPVRRRLGQVAAIVAGLVAFAPMIGVLAQTILPKQGKIPYIPLCTPPCGCLTTGSCPAQLTCTDRYHTAYVCACTDTIDGCTRCYLYCG
jgi:hypothetical protein